MKTLLFLFLIAFLAFLLPAPLTFRRMSLPLVGNPQPGRHHPMEQSGRPGSPASRSWMDVTLPGGMVVHQCHLPSFPTPSGNILSCRSGHPIFHGYAPAESGLNGARMLGMVLRSMLADGNSLTPAAVGPTGQPGYTDPAVLPGGDRWQENIWSMINFNFLGELFKMSWDSGFLVNALLLYLNGVANCANIPGGCAGLLVTVRMAAACPNHRFARLPPLPRSRRSGHPENRSG